MTRALVIPLLLIPAALSAHAQEPLPPGVLHRLRIEATPVGALPRVPLRMPASRNQNYWAFNLHAGYRESRAGADLPALAAGVDLQWLGGSVIGVTAGRASRDCEWLGPECGEHLIFGVQGQLNVVTGASHFGERFGDYGANARVGMELGFGYAPDAVPGSNACTIHAGMPLTLAMFQNVRFVAFATPVLIRELDCGGEPVSTSATYLLGGGIGVQQLVHRGLDVSVGMQRILRSHSGYHFGVSLTYTRLP